MIIIWLCDSPLNEDQKDYLQTIRKSSETLLHILNDILDLAKIEAGKMVLHPADLVFEDLLDRLMSLFTPIAHQKGNKVSYNFFDKKKRLNLYCNFYISFYFSSFTVTENLLKPRKFTKITPNPKNTTPKIY